MPKFLDKNGLIYLKEIIISKIPTKISQLTNDTGYLSSIPDEYITDTELNARVPETTSSDNDKILSIVNGSPAWITITNAEGVRY